METTVGQFFKKPIPEIFENYSKKWKGIVFLQLFACFSRVKGRDLYDLAFLRGQNIQPDWILLNQKL